MVYYKDIVEEYEDIEERYELALERIGQIPDETLVISPYKEYFNCVADFFIKIDKVLQHVKNNTMSDLTLEEHAEINKSLYQDVLGDNYNHSYCNAEYIAEHIFEKASADDMQVKISEKALNDEKIKLAQYMAFLYYEIRNQIGAVYEGRITDITLYAELFIEIYLLFQDEPDVKEIKEAVYYFENDYAEYFMSYRVREKLDSVLSFATDIVMDRDLNDLSYLYMYGEYIGENEIKFAEFLNKLPEEKIEAMASTYTEGFRLGFEAARIDMSKKKTVNIRYAIGQERMVRAAIKQFRAMGLEPVCFRYDTNRINRRLMNRVGYSGTAVNKQMDYDHRMDEALFLDKKLMERKLEVTRQAYEKYAYEASVYAGPACIEIFGEVPFAPVNKAHTPVLSEKQQEITVEYTGAASEIINTYIPGSEYSFTIIAYPSPEIGDNFEEIFAEIVKINTLDNDTFRRIQQSIIDELDKATHVRVVGTGANVTDMTIQLHVLNNPDAETNFENCVADVNIPVGEVFTSPVLTGTEGTLNVSEVYLNDLKYTNLKITFKDGKVDTYTCDNFQTEEENTSFIKENLLLGRDTLPIGEFAIGTNTTAYVIANKYGIVDKLPILIVEKMGPHFAVGDTCYSRSEENKLYNPDGKEIIAKDNECSVLRDTDVTKAYFNCHTDITIPYNEIGGIYSIHADGTEVPIIINGRFVLPGTEELNKPFEE
jgi:leucyl aminopeptidase (aminopeptidase T)